jgi:hypothetical protein
MGINSAEGPLQHLDSLCIIPTIEVEVTPQIDILHQITHASERITHLGSRGGQMLVLQTMMNVQASSLIGGRIGFKDSPALCP